MRHNGNMVSVSTTPVVHLPDGTDYRQSFFFVSMLRIDWDFHIGFPVLGRFWQIALRCSHSPARVRFSLRAQMVLLQEFLTTVTLTGCLLLRWSQSRWYWVPFTSAFWVNPPCIPQHAEERASNSVMLPGRLASAPWMADAHCERVRLGQFMQPCAIVWRSHQERSDITEAAAADLRASIAACVASFFRNPVKRHRASIEDYSGHRLGSYLRRGIALLTSL